MKYILTNQQPQDAKLACNADVLITKLLAQRNERV